MSNEEKIKDVFTKIFPEIENDYDINREQSDYENWDSFAHVNLISEIEDQFGIQLETDEIISISSAKISLRGINDVIIPNAKIEFKIVIFIFLTSASLEFVRTLVLQQ